MSTVTEPVWSVPGDATFPADPDVSRARWSELLVQHAKEGLYVLDGRRLVFVNQEMVELTGYAAAELTSLDFSISNLVASGGRGFLEGSAHGRPDRADCGEGCDLVILRKGGGRRRVCVRTSVAGEGDHAVVVGVVRDVTDERRTEHDLARQTRIVEAVSELFREALHCETVEEVARTCISGATRFLSSPLGFLGLLNNCGRLDVLATVGGGLFEWKDGLGSLRDMEIRGVWGVALRSRRTQVVNSPQDHPRGFRLPPGHPPIRCFLGVPLLHHGTTVGMIGLANREVGYGRDDREAVEALAVAFVEALMRKRAEVRLRRSESDYRLLVQNAVFGIYRSSIDGRFLEVNPALVRMLGYDSEEDLLEADLARDIYCDSGERQRRIDALGDTGRIEDMELSWRKRDGGSLVVRLNGHALKSAMGDLTGFEVIVEDVTEKRDLESRLRRSERLEGVGQLAGGIAHDFNNLLTVISGQAELALRTKDVDPRARTRFLEIRRAAATAADLTRQLLAFSRKQILDLKLVNVNDLLLDLGRMLRRLISEDIHVDILPHPGLWNLRADPTQLEQVILNLAVNARDAMLRGGVLTIETRNVQVDERYAATHDDLKPGPHVLVSVSDTGTGMTPDVREKIFEPFFTTKPEGKGTGLGLATVYGIVKQSRGSVSVYSEPGVGTTFQLYLPAAETENLQERAVGSSRVPGGRGETILVVEDQEGVRTFAVEILESVGYRVLAARDGEEALAMAQKERERIDVLLTDVIMPKLGGKPLAEALSESHPEAEVLFMSGYTENAIVHHGVLEPGRRLIHKPFGSEELCRRIREALRQD